MGELLKRLTGPALRLVATVAAVGLIVLVSIGARSVEHEENGEIESVSSEPLVVSVVEVKQETGYARSIEYLGRIEAGRESAVGFELSGRLIAVERDEGETINEGEIIARMDTELLQAKRAELAARFTEAKARAEQGRIRFERFKAAESVNAVATQEFDDARQEYLALQAVENRMELAVASIDVEIRKAVLRAPFNAIVLQRMVDEGVVLDAGAPVLQLIERGKAEARIGVPPDVANQLAVGEAFELQVGGETVEGKLIAVLPRRSDRTRTVELRVQLAANIQRFRSGETVVMKRKQMIPAEGFWLPMSALVEGERGLWTVYAVVEESDQRVIVTEPVELIHQTSSAVFVRAGLADRTQVVGAGLHRVTPGLTVRVAAAEREE